MADNRLIEELAVRLKAKSIYDIRQVARQVGVSKPTEGRKERLMEEILNIAAGKTDPASHSASGAPPKSAEYDRQLVVDILRCREICISSFGETERKGIEMQVASAAVSDEATEGLLFAADGVWYINSVKGGEVLVSDSFISRFSLREGDYIKGALRRKSDGALAGLVSISEVNGILPEAVSSRLDFETLEPVYPVKKLSVARSGEVTGKMIDLLFPVAAGQRAFVVAPHGTGKTAILKEIAAAIEKNYPNVKIVVALIDARPEEAADFKRAFSRVDVIASTMDAGARVHIKTAEIALGHAKRQAELRRDVVFILDDITKLTRAYNSGSQVASGLDTSALDAAKRFISSARNTESGASLTIISALVEGDDAIESAIYSGLKDSGNMRITLSQKLARLKIYPPIDIENSGASGDERILSREELEIAVALRKKHDGGENVIKLLESYPTNEELLKAIK